MLWQKDSKKGVIKYLLIYMLSRLVLVTIVRCGSSSFIVFVVRCGHGWWCVVVRGGGPGIVVVRHCPWSWPWSSVIMVFALCSSLVPRGCGPLSSMNIGHRHLSERARSGEERAQLLQHERSHPPHPSPPASCRALPPSFWRNRVRCCIGSAIRSLLVLDWRRVVVRRTSPVVIRVVDGGRSLLWGWAVAVIGGWGWWWWWFAESLGSMKFIVEQDADEDKWILTLFWDPSHAKRAHSKSLFHSSIASSSSSYDFETLGHGLILNNGICVAYRMNLNNQPHPAAPLSVYPSPRLPVFA